MPATGSKETQDRNEISSKASLCSFWGISKNKWACHKMQKVKIGPVFLEIGCKKLISQRTECRYCVTLRHGEEIKL